MEKRPKMPRQVVVLVLGVPRSARTDAWAQALAALGMQLPKLSAIDDLDIAEALKVQPLVRAHGDFLAGLGRAWSSVHAFAAEDFSGENFDSLVDDLAEILDEAFEAGEPWVIAEPQLAFTLPAWRIVAERLDLDLRAIVPLAHPRDAAAALAGQGDLSIEHAYAIWTRFMLDAERRTRGLRRVFIAADAVETRWRLAVDDAAGWLQIGLSERLEGVAAAVEGALKGMGTASVTKAAAATPDAETAAEGFAGVAFDLLERLTLEPSSRHLMDKLDEARAGFDGEAARVEGVLPVVTRALADRTLWYRHERAERIEAQYHLKGFAKELEKLREIIRRGDGDLDIEQIAHERMRKAQGKWDGERGLEGEAAEERDPAVLLAEAVETLASESERIHTSSALVVAEYDRLSHLRSAEAAVLEQVQHDYAMLLSRFTAEGDSKQRLKFDNALLSARSAAEGRIRRSLEAESAAHRTADRDRSAAVAPFEGLSRSLVCVVDSASGQDAKVRSREFIRVLAEDLGFAVEVVLLGGPDATDYGATVHSVVRNPPDDIITELATTLFERGFRGAIAWSAGVGEIARVLKQVGFRVTGLVHEVAGGGAKLSGRAFVQACDRIVFSTEALRLAYQQRLATAGEKGVTLRAPTGHARVPIDPVERRRVRREMRDRLGLAAAAKVVINIGLGDRRGGVDLFFDVARTVIRQRNDVDFVWIGDVDPQLEATLRASAASPDFKGRLVLLPRVDEAQIPPLLAGADLYALTSRDDGLPAVVLAALAAGLPVVAFDQTVGARELIGTSGDVVEGLDPAGMAYAIGRHLSAPAADTTGSVASAGEYRRYVMDVAALADPSFRRVSCVVPTANDRTRIEERLRSIEQQSYPLYEVIVIDNGSHDGTLAWLELNLERFVPGAQLRQRAAAASALMLWRQAVQQATGDCLWMALPGEMAVPGFLAEVVAGFRAPGVVVSYAASRTDATVGSLDTWADTQEVEDGRAAIAKSLAVRNTIATGGALVADRQALQSSLDFLGEGSCESEATGEWLLWIELMSRGRVASTPAVLNHRYAPPASGSRDASFSEILEAQAYAQVRGSISADDTRARDAAWAVFVQQEQPIPAAANERRGASPPPLQIPALAPNPPPVVEPSLAKALSTFARARAQMHRVPPDVHENDFIYRFIVNNRTFLTRKAAVDYYFDDGRQSAEQLRAILARSGAKRILEMENPSLFEFASGYGCVSRHLPLVLPNFEIVPCDIHEEAVDFTRDRLGLNAVLSKSVPEDLRLGRTFDVVFALSFFSHMPDRTWGRWLATLYAHLAPGGSFVFTTHGMASRQFLGDPELNDEGFWFTRDSEQKDLDVNEYGQTVTMPGYVLRQIYKHAPGQLSYFQQASWWGHQDVYVVTKPKPDPDRSRGLQA